MTSHVAARGRICIFSERLKQDHLVAQYHLTINKLGHSFTGNFIYCWKAYIGRKQVIIAKAKQLEA